MLTRLKLLHYLTTERDSDHPWGYNSALENMWSYLLKFLMLHLVPGRTERAVTTKALPGKPVQMCSSLPQTWAPLVGFPEEAPQTRRTTFHTILKHSARRPGGQDGSCGHNRCKGKESLSSAPWPPQNSRISNQVQSLSVSHSHTVVS